MARLSRKVHLPGPAIPSAMQALAFYVRPVGYVRWAQRLYGHNFRVHIPPLGEGAYLADPDAIKAIFTSKDDTYRAGEANWVLRPILGRRSVLLLDGDEHMAQRKMLLPPFHGESVRRYAETVREAATAEALTWPVREPFEARPAMQRITLEVILRAVIGLRDPGRLQALRVLLTELLDLRDRDLLLFAIWPSFSDTRLARHVRPFKLRHQVDALLDEEIHARRSGQTGDDVLSLLVGVRDEHGVGLTDEELRDELITLLVAGHETTATALAWALERLTRHPAALARLCDEVDAGEAEDYLDAVCRETLRLRPVIQDVMRRTTRDVEIGGGRVEKGALVFPAIALAHLALGNYDSPDEFRPERFLDGAKPGAYSWLPFGGGTRRCIGASFALMEMKAALAAVLRTVRLATTSAPDERARLRHVTLVPHRGARIAVAERRSRVTPAESGTSSSWTTSEPSSRSVTATT